MAFSRMRKWTKDTLSQYTTLSRIKEANQSEWIWRLLFSILLTISHWRIWRWSFLFQWRFEYCGVFIVCNVVENKCERRDVTWTRVITMTMTIMTTRPLQSTKKWFTKLKYNNCLSLLVCLMSSIKLSFLFCHFSIHLASRTIFNIQFAIRFHYIVNYLR
jgi:hypothetical protein